MPIKVTHHPGLKLLGPLTSLAGDELYRLSCADEKLRKIRDEDCARRSATSPPFPKTLGGLPFRHD
jgi:hypothetical protein